MPEAAALPLAGLQQSRVAAQPWPAAGLLGRKKLPAFLPVDPGHVSFQWQCQARLGVSGVALRIWATAACVGCLPPQHHSLAAEVYLPKADLLLAAWVASAIAGQPILSALRAVVAPLRRKVAEERTGCCAGPAPVA
jgi:hypothetical protein